MHILFDIGGTKMRIAGLRHGATFETPVSVKTPQDFEEAMGLFAETAQRVAGGEAIEHCVGGVAGAFNPGKTQLVKSPNLSDWEGKPLKEHLERLGAPVVIENDAALAGLGEAVDGAGRGYSIVAYLTVGTGVGGARIVDAHIDRNANGFEPGHHIIALAPHEAGSSSYGNDLESYISGRAFEKRYGIKPVEVNDPLAWSEAARVLAVGICNTLLFWSPDAVVLGGSMITGNPAISLEEIRAELENIFLWGQVAPVLKAELGDAGGIHGAMAMLRSMSPRQ